MITIKTLPIEQWLEDAPLWLEVSGPPVPAAWREQWPEIIVDELTLEHQGSERRPTSLLQPLARMMQRQRSLQASFDDRLRRSKLGALKQLAYGLSHEINNPLANISTRAQQLQRGEADETRVAILQRIIDQVYRAHEMIADLMFYAHPPTAHPKTMLISAKSCGSRRWFCRGSRSTGNTSGVAVGSRITDCQCRRTNDFRRRSSIDSQCD